MASIRRTRSALLAGLFFLGCGPRTTGQSAPVGSMAPQYLLASPMGALVIEVTPVQGREPDPQSLQLLLQRVSEHCRKPGGVQLVMDPGVAPVGSGSHVYTIQDLAAFEAATRTMTPPPGTALLHILYLDGSAGEASGGEILGIAFEAGAFAIFKDQIQRLSVDNVLESFALVHEFGHELGLVNIGTPMVSPHEDMAHPGHCTNPACVMFWQLESPLAVRQGMRPIPDYDQACMADLAAAGGQ